MHWQKEKRFHLFLLIMKFANGVIVKTEFKKVFGDAEGNIGCSSVAGRSDDYLAVALNESNECTYLDWAWGSSPSYMTGSTYFEKRRVIHDYDTPIVLGGGIKLPITFRAGSHITMTIEFTTDEFSTCAIQLMDNFEESFSVYDEVPETVLIHVLMRPLDNKITFKSWHGGWKNHNTSSYPFTAGPTPHIITFKALTDDMQVLVGGVEKARYSHRVTPEKARQFLFPNAGLLLHKIEFFGA